MQMSRTNLKCWGMEGRPVSEHAGKWYEQAGSCTASRHSEELRCHSKGDRMPLGGFRHRTGMIQFIR